MAAPLSIRAEHPIMSKKEFGLFLLVCAFWGAAIVAVKIGLRYSQPIALAGARFFVAGLLLAVYAAARRKRLMPTLRELPGIALLGIFNFGLVLIFHNSGLRTTSAGLAAVLLHCHSIIVAVLAPLILRERVRQIHLLGILVGFLGVFTAVGANGDGAVTGGRVLILIAATSWAAGTLIFKKVAPGRDVLVLTAQSLVFAGVFDLLVSAISEDGPRFNWNGTFIAAYLFMTIPGQALTGALWFWLLERGAAARASAFLFLVPVFGVLFSALILSEKLTPRFLIGGLLVVTGIILVNARRQEPIMIET